MNSPRPVGALYFPNFLVFDLRKTDYRPDQEPGWVFEKFKLARYLSPVQRESCFYQRRHSGGGPKVTHIRFNRADGASALNGTAPRSERLLSRLRFQSGPPVSYQSHVFPRKQLNQA